MPYIGQQPAPKVITSSDLSADVVTEAKIADNAVENEHLNANVITGHTALGATPADTDELLVSDAGTLKRVDFSYLKGGGEKTLLATTTVSSAVSGITFDNTYFTSSYRDYVLTASQLDYTSDSQRTYLTISSDNGSSFKSDSTYRFGVYGFEDTGGNISRNSSSNDTGFELFSTVSTEADARTSSFRLYMINPLSTSTFFSYYNYGFTHTASDRTNTFHGAGYFNTSVSDAINAIKIAPSSGNFDQGVFKLYGVI